MRHLLALLLLLALPVWAQQEKPANLQPLPVVPPPPPEMSSWDETLEPQVTIHKNDKEERAEYRHNGKLYMIKVTPVGGPTYYLVDHQGSGAFTRMDTISTDNKPPMWVIFRF